MSIRIFTDVPFLKKHSSDELEIDYSRISASDVVKQLPRFRKYSLLVLDGLRKTTFLFMFLHLVGLINGKLVVLDPIFVKPNGLVQRITSRIKGFLLNRSFALYVYAKNNKGVEQYFRIKSEKLVYIPYKINGLELIKEKYSDRKSEGYVFSGGRSRRDYATLIKAASQLQDISFVIVSPTREELLREDCIVYNGELPSNVSIINDNGTVDEFFEIMSKSELVVLPISTENIAPAGISVYLNAMALKRPVIITEGPSVDEILTHDQAVMVKAGDVEELTNRIREVYYDENKKRMLAENGYTYAMSLGSEKDLFQSIEKSILHILK